uniref:TTC3/DZIP3-like helical domain-containing protein n=1 Tax=Plectus sambesii TaxID=2011161 RepID=A0A914XAC0_9BILA
MNNETASLHAELERIKNELMMAQCAKQEMKTEQEWRLEEMRIKHERALDALRTECNRRVQQAENRAVQAEMGIYKLKSKVELTSLQRSLRDVEENRESLSKIITKMDQLACTTQERADTATFSSALQQWTSVRDCLLQIIQSTKSQYDDIIGQIQSGTPLGALRPVVIAERPAAPTVPPLPEWIKQRLLAQETSSIMPLTPSTPTSTNYSRICPPQPVAPPPGLHHIDQLSQSSATSNLPKSQSHAGDSSLSASSSRATSSTNSRQSVAPSSLPSNNLPCTVGKVEKLYEEVGKRVRDASRDEIKAAMISAKRGQPNGSFKGVPYGRVIDSIVEKLMGSRATVAVHSPRVMTVQQTRSSQYSSVGVGEAVEAQKPPNDDVYSIGHNASHVECNAHFRQ